MRNDDMFKKGYVETIWGSKIDIDEAYAYHCRQPHLFSTLMTQAWRILEPDETKRIQAVSEVCYEVQKPLWPNTLEGLNKMRENFEFPKDAGSIAQLAGLRGDYGDEFGLLPGIVKVFTPDYVEKEIFVCPVAIVGSEMCKGTCQNIQLWCDVGQQLEGGPKWEVNMSEAIGWGNTKCRLHIESNDDREISILDHNNAPVSRATTVSPASTEWPVSRVIRDRELRVATGAAATVKSYEACYKIDQIFYYFWTARAMDKTVKDYKERARILKPVFYGGGKAQFVDPWAKEALYKKLGIPEDVQDGRAMAAYIEYICLSRAYPYVIEEFGEDRACINIDRKTFGLMALAYNSANFDTIFKEYLMANEAYFNGAVKTLLLPSWSVEVTDMPDENIVKFEIVKKVDRTQ